MTLTLSLEDLEKIIRHGALTIGALTVQIFPPRVLTNREAWRPIARAVAERMPEASL